MNGLRYVMFVKEVSLKELSSEMGISQAAINDWSNQRKPIPPNRKEQLSQLLGVAETYLDKEINIKDKLEIELQISTLNREELRLEDKVVEVIDQNAVMGERYLQLLEGVKQQSRVLHDIQKNVEKLNLKMIDLNQIKSLIEDPKGYSSVLDILSTLQEIRMITKDI